VGANGSGKTTLMNTLRGTVPADKGTILLDGRPIDGLPPHKIRHLGLAGTHQVPRPFGSMTVQDNVALSCVFGSERMSRARARSEAEQYLRLTKLTDVAHRTPGDLNLHQLRFLELARALAAKPKVLLLDEVFAGLTPVEIDASVEMLRALHSSGVTIVIVEHIMRLVAQLTTDLAVLDRGQVIAAGATEVVLRDAAVVSAYLGGGHAER
jgi:ABC-type branched-subunit amino acid transport system ATPase component